MPQFISSNQEKQVQQETNHEIKEPMLMHLVIEQDFNVYGLHQEDFELLRSCSVWHKQHENPNDTSILGQKITVPHEKMEEILEIFDSYGEFSFVLRRYEYGRYALEVYKPNTPAVTA